MHKRKYSIIKVLTFLLIIALVSCAQAERTDTNVLDTIVNTETDVVALDTLVNEEVETDEQEIKIRFLELGSKTCIPCKMMKEVMEKVEENYSSVKVEFYDVNDPDGRIKAQLYKIRVIPTQIFLNENNEVIHRHEGFYPYEQLSEFLDKALEDSK